MFPEYIATKLASPASPGRSALSAWGTGRTCSPSAQFGMTWARSGAAPAATQRARISSPSATTASARPSTERETAAIVRAPSEPGRSAPKAMAISG